MLREHATALAFYAGISLAISWPLARHFTTVLIGGGLDALSHLWGVWHAVQALLGRDPFFSTTLLYYPTGASLFLHSAGPLTGVLALPFWPFGPIAGYNGSLLVGLTLTGYGMYLLAREIGCSRPAALFAGLALLAAPAHLVGLRGDLATLFLGLMPLALLVLRRGLDLSRTIWWAAPFAALVVLILLHSPLQLVQVALAAPLFVLAAVYATPDRRGVLRRTLILIMIAAAAAAGPLVAATARAAEDPAMPIDRSTESASKQPDVMQFVLPSSFSLLFGERTTATLARWNVTPDFETEVAVPWTAIVLMSIALATRTPSSGTWVLLALGAAILSLGPTPRAFGLTRGLFGFDVTLPYAWITALPGLDVLRPAARFMQVGFVGIAAAAGLGLSRVGTSWPDARNVVAVFASLLLLAEVWPVPWPVQALLPTPAFYEKLADEPGEFGVLDLPIRALPYASPQDHSARYQAFQIVHGKGIAAGYLPRTYDRHPVSPCVFTDERAPHDLRVNGQPSHCEPAAIHQLASHGYRYVVWHKPSGLDKDNLPGGAAEQDAQAFVGAAFGTRPPVVEEMLARVWAIPPAAESLPALPVIELGRGWYPAEPSWRWASSPASITLTAPRALKAELVISVPLLHARDTGRALGQASVLVVTCGDQNVSVPVRAGDTVRVPLTLAAGGQEVSLALGAGNFRPSDYGEADTRVLSFAIEWIDLREQVAGPD